MKGKGGSAFSRKGGPKGQAKGQSKGQQPAKAEPEEPDEVELEGGDDDDDDAEEEEVDVGDDEEWMAFQSGVLSALVSGGSMSTGKLGHALGAKKKPVTAALFKLLESGLVTRSDGTPPKWSAAAGVDLSEIVTAPIAQRYLYDASKKKSGPKASGSDFETMKSLVRSHFAGNNSISAGALGFKLGANRKVVNAALYACEKEGTAWTVSEPGSGQKLRWSGVPVQCHESVPAAFAYDGGGAAGAALEVQQPPLKKARLQGQAVQAAVQAGPTTGDAFEDMKLCLWARVAAKGEKGVSSGALGFEVSADRKAITAALYSCQKEGKVKNTAEEGKPYWVCVAQPPDEAYAMDVPEKYGYKGGKDGGQAVAAQTLVKPIAVKLPVAANVAGLSTKQQQALAKKGQGKGKQMSIAPVAKAAAVQLSSGAVNAVAALNEWAQKSKKSLSFSDVGQDGSGNFLCQVVLDNQPIAVTGARNKKQAKSDAAAAALQALGLA